MDKEVVVAKFATTTQHGAIEGKTQSHLVDFPLKFGGKEKSVYLCLHIMRKVIKNK